MSRRRSGRTCASALRSSTGTRPGGAGTRGRTGTPPLGKPGAGAGTRLLVDEVYRYLEFDEADRLPAGVDAGRHVISLGVMSKSFAMAGLRIGWGAARGRAGPGRAA